MPLDPSIRRLFFVVAVGAMLVLVVAGCSHVPVRSLWALRSVDIMTTNFAALGAAARAPEAFRPSPDGARLVFKVWAEGESADDGLEVAAMLVPIDDVGRQPGLEREAQEGAVIHGYSIAPEAVAELETMRREIQAMKAVEQRGHLSIAIRVDGCWAATPPTGPVLLTTYIRTIETGSFVPLTRDVDLRTVGAETGVSVTFPSCAEAAAAQRGQNETRPNEDSLG